MNVYILLANSQNLSRILGNGKQVKEREYIKMTLYTVSWDLRPAWTQEKNWKSIPCFISKPGEKINSKGKTKQQFAVPQFEKEDIMKKVTCWFIKSSLFAFVDGTEKTNYTRVYA